MSDLHTFVNTSPEQREEQRKQREFEDWSKQVKPGWAPNASQLGKTIKR